MQTKTEGTLTAQSISQTQSQLQAQLQAIVIIQKECPLCGSDELKPVCSERNHFTNRPEQIMKAFNFTWIQLLRCRRCSFVFTKELPYEKTFFEERYNIPFDPEAESKNRFKDRILENLLDRLRTFGKAGGAFLDVGSFAGVFLRLAEKRGFRVEGIELNPTMATYCRDALKLKIHQSSFLDAPCGSNEYDVLTLIDVLEHLTQPRRVLEKCFSCLKDDGYLVIKVPNFNPQRYKQSLAHMMRINDLGVFENFGHINHFSPKSLRFALENLGFEVLEITVALPEEFPRTSFKNITRNIFRGWVSKSSEALRKISGLVLGFNLIVIARKPSVNPQ